MADKVEKVMIPKAMFDNLEERSSRLARLEAALLRDRHLFMQYEIKGVLTIPPSGANASPVLAAVRDLIKNAVIMVE